MNANPLVSCLMVTNGRPAFVRKAVEWFRAQTWKRKELVIVDDSPKDKRVADLRGASDVRYITSDVPVEMGAKHDRAIDAAQGDVLAYNDDDDLYMPRRLVQQLEPIVLGKATITGIPRGYIVRAPGARFFNFKPLRTLGKLEDWIGNGIDRWEGKPITAHFAFHDGTAMFARSALRHGIRHPAVPVGQKVDFLNSLIAAGEKWAAIANDKLFVYVRHRRNTWNYAEQKVHVPVDRPAWIPPEVVSFWKEGVA